MIRQDSLTARSVAGGTVFSSNNLDLLRDLDLAGMAELAKPRSIKETYRSVIADGGVRVLGSAAAEVCAVCGVDADGSRLDSSEINGAISAGAINLSENEADPFADLDRPVVWAEYETVPAGNRGRTQRTIVFYGNRHATLRIANRLRTPKAVELQGAVGRIFFAALDGKLSQPAQVDVAALVKQVTRDMLPMLGELLHDRLGSFHERVDAMVDAKLSALHAEVADAKRGVSEARALMKSANDIVVPAAENPERFQEYGRVGDSKYETGQLRLEMDEAARRCGVTFGKVHGALRSELKIPGYKLVRTAMADHCTKFIKRLTAASFPDGGAYRRPSEPLPLLGMLIELNAKKTAS